jgi:hypothetical protein
MQMLVIMFMMVLMMVLMVKLMIVLMAVLSALRILHRLTICAYDDVKLCAFVHKDICGRMPTPQYEIWLLKFILLLLKDRFK